MLHRREAWLGGGAPGEHDSRYHGAAGWTRSDARRHGNADSAGAAHCHTNTFIASPNHANTAAYRRRCTRPTHTHAAARGNPGAYANSAARANLAAYANSAARANLTAH
jgi:hypothetical protein